MEDTTILLAYRNNDVFRQDKSGQESSKAVEIKASAELFTRAWFSEGLIPQSWLRNENASRFGFAEEQRTSIV